MVRDGPRRFKVIGYRTVALASHSIFHGSRDREFLAKRYFPERRLYWERLVGTEKICVKAKKLLRWQACTGPAYCGIEGPLAIAIVRGIVEKLPGGSSFTPPDDGTAHASKPDAMLPIDKRHSARAVAKK